MQQTIWLASLLLSSTLLVAACGGGSDRTKAQVRLVNASGGYAQLDLRVDGQVRQGGVAYGATSTYAEVDPDDADTEINAANSPTPLLSFTPAVSKDRYYTVLAFGEAGALRQALLDDNVSEPADNRALLRVVNGASDAGAVDIYLTGSNDTLQASVPVQSSAAYGTVGGWITVNSATWRLRVTAAGSKTDVRLDLPAVSLPSRHISTLVITPGGGGLLVNGLLLAQRSSITRADNTQARVRLAAGASNLGSVALTIGSTVLATAQPSPTGGEYQLVAAGTPTVTAAVNGSALTVPAPPPLMPGRDYTLLVAGDPAAARATWIADDNKVASDSSRARLRLVNGLAEATPLLSMSLGLLPVADGVPNGAGSAPLAVTASTTADLTVTATASGASSTLAVLDDRTLRAGGVYTVFVLGAQAAPRVDLVQDR